MIINIILGINLLILLTVIINLINITFLLKDKQSNTKNMLNSNKDYLELLEKITNKLININNKLDNINNKLDKLHKKIDYHYYRKSKNGLE